MIIMLQPSHSVRSVWIEIYLANHSDNDTLSHSVRSVWIEILVELSVFGVSVMSHSVRSVWIEISFVQRCTNRLEVTLRKECVD